METMGSPGLYAVGGSVKPPFALSCLRTRSVLIRCCTGGLILRHTSKYFDRAPHAQSTLSALRGNMESTSMSANETSSATADKDTSRSGTLEAKGGFTEPPTPYNRGESIDPIRDRHARIVHRELEKMERGETQKLSEQHNTMLPSTGKPNQFQ